MVVSGAEQQPPTPHTTMSMMKHFKHGTEVSAPFDPKEPGTFTVSREIVEVVKNPSVIISGTPINKVYPAIPSYDHQTVIGWKIGFHLGAAVKTVNIKYDPNIDLKDLADATFFRVSRSPAPSTREIVAVMSHMRKVRHMDTSAMVRVSGREEQWVKVYSGLTRLHPKLIDAIDLPEGNPNKISLVLGYRLSGVPSQSDQILMWERLKAIPLLSTREYGATLMKEKMGFRKGYTPAGKLTVPRLDQLPLQF